MKTLIITFCVIVASCHPSKLNSRMKVANGLDSQESDFPAVTRIYSAESMNASMVGTCSATAVSSKVLITAAHCLVGDNGQIEGAVYIKDKSDQKIEALRANVVIHPKYSHRGGSMEGNFDMAVVKFDKDVFENWVGTSLIPGEMGETITLVGYGITTIGGTDSGKKRYGTNKIKANQGKPDASGIGNAPDTIILGDGVKDASDADSKGIARGENVSNLQGDSGGPIFLNGALLGVASTVGGFNEAKLNGSYISVYYHKDWLKGLGFPICNLSVECKDIPKSNAEVKNPTGKPNNPNPTVPTDPQTGEYSIFAAVDGDTSPKLKINPTSSVDSVEICVGATKDIAASCTNKKTAVLKDGFYESELGPQTEDHHVLIKCTKASKQKLQMIKLTRKT